MVIHDIIDILGRPQRSYPECFMSLYFVVEKYECVTLVTKVTDKQTKRQIDAGEINITC